MDRKEWNKIAGTALIIGGIVVAVLGVTLTNWEDLYHLFGTVRGPR